MTHKFKRIKNASLKEFCQEVEADLEHGACE